jgi:outer membrane lipoprotein LolB
MPIPFLFAILCTIVLSGCALRPADVSQNPMTQSQSLASLQQWQVNGKLAIITSEDRKSASLHWRQHEQSISLLLSSVVGSTIAKLDYDGTIASLNADDQTWQDRSPSELIFRTTGWQVPVEQLSEWMKGEVNAAMVDTRFDNGLVQSFTTQCEACLPWKIQYNSYGEFEFEQGTLTLPTSMRLSQEASGTLLILRIDNWK